MLHHPFENFVDLLSVDDVVYDGYATAFEACQQLHSHQDDFYGDPPPDQPESDDEEQESDDEEEELGGEDEDEPLADFEALARRNPHCELPCVDFMHDVGSRDLDRA